MSQLLEVSPLLDVSQFLEVSQSALRALQEALSPAAEGTPAVRVSARLADTGIPAYDLAPADGPAPGDTVIGLDGLVVYVDPGSVPLVAGVRIDHLSTPRGTGFLFRPSDAQLAERVRTALETVRPELQADGGDVELVDVREGRAVLAFRGSCVGCGLAGLTLTRLLEQHLRTMVPELMAVTAEIVRPAGASMLERSADQ